MPGQQKSMTGKVVSDKMDKTVVVVVESTTRHRLYHKIMRRTKRYLAHDDRFESKPGDVVRIIATSPVSRHKRWRVAEVLRRGEVAEIAPRDIDKAYLGTKREKAGDEADTAAEQPMASPPATVPEPPTATAVAEAEAPVDADAPTDASPPADADAGTDEPSSASTDEGESPADTGDSEEKSD